MAGDRWYAAPIASQCAACAARRVRKPAQSRLARCDQATSAIAGSLGKTMYSIWLIVATVSVHNAASIPSTSGSAIPDAISAGSQS